MCTLVKYIRKRINVQYALEIYSCEQHEMTNNIQWQTYLAEQVDDFVEVSCCPRIPHPSLKYGFRPSARVPKFLKQKFVNNMCDEYGAETLLQMSTYNILGEYNDVIECL